MDQVSARAWSELLHAEVGYLLRAAGIPCLHIKGPTVALWLYDEGERSWGDVDVLVPPGRMDEALAALQHAGMSEAYPGVNRHTSNDHAVTLLSLDGSFEIDVHDRFEGIDRDPGEAFEELWRRREPARLGHVDVWFPDLTTRALLVAVNTARQATDKAREDLRRLVASAGDDDWAALVWLAGRIEALPALRAGLEILPEGADVVRRTALAEVDVSPEWRLRVGGAPRTALRLDELRRMSWSRRIHTILRWIVPAPAIIRMRDPAARGNAARLVVGYLRRWRDGVTSIAPSVGALRRARRAEQRPHGDMHGEGTHP